MKETTILKICYVIMIYLGFIFLILGDGEGRRDVRTNLLGFLLLLSGAYFLYSIW